MLFSVLLPTHNRLEFLRHAVESVRRQDDPGWEIVISDNDSAEDIAGFVDGLMEPRVRYVRTDRFLPVTENWNNALRHSTGDYIVMLGDDDALLPGYFSALRALVERFAHPDAVYSGAYLYAYPGVLPEAPEGYLKLSLTAPFFAGTEEPFVLDPSQARDLARAALDFRVQYDFNMQYVAVSRAAVDDLAGDGEFFRSPFPDYYAMNLVFARAERIAVDPHPRVVVGITPRSHGYFHFNRRESEARALLYSDQVEPEIRHDLAPIILPGTNMNTSWLLAMESLHRRLGSLPETRPDYVRYRRLQALHCEQGYHIHRTITRAELKEAEAGLPPVQRLALRLVGPIAGALLRNAPGLRPRCGAVFDRLVGQSVTPAKVAEPEVGRYRDIIDVFERHEQEAERAGHAS
jgi:glycosyltransferase involved in cell wall biosynthesis